MTTSSSSSSHIAISAWAPIHHGRAFALQTLKCNVQTIDPRRYITRLQDEPQPHRVEDVSIYKCIFTGTCLHAFRFHDGDLDVFRSEIATMVTAHLIHQHHFDPRLFY